MHPADSLFLVLIALSMWKGFRRGLVRESFALAGWVAGILVAINSWPLMASLLANLISTPSLRQASAFILLCLVVVFISYVLAELLRSVLTALAFGPADRLLGLCFGAVRGLLIVLVLVGLLAPVVKHDKWWHEAVLPQALLPYVPVAVEVADEVKEKIHHLPPVHVPVKPQA